MIADGGRVPVPGEATAVAGVLRADRPRAVDSRPIGTTTGLSR
jgi:hypothetical protein